MKYRTGIFSVLFFYSFFFYSGCDENNLLKKLSLKKPELKAEKLYCEYRTNPLGIDMLKPRLSWIVTSQARGQKQTAYRILAASSKENLKSDKGDLWDSGIVKSDQTSCIIYDGGTLHSRTQCFWKVKVWDMQNKESQWSETAFWSMGFLEPKDWQGVWTGFDIDESKSKDKNLILPPARYLRKNFVIGKEIKNAYLYATALGIYNFQINGKETGADFFSPGWTDYNKRIYYRTYDVTKHIKKGKNAIGAIIADGWFAGYVGYSKARNLYGRNIRLLAQLHIEYADGTTQIVSTDKSWKASLGPVLQADFLMGETYDARKEMQGWSQADFDDSKWSAVSTAAEINPLIQAAVTEPVVVFSELKPKKITEPQAGRFVFDMGQNFAGVVRIKVRGKNGQKIILRHAERLNPDGTIYTTNLRNARAEDAYICKGDGVEVWHPQFTFHGFQYVELSGIDYKPGEDTITGLALSNDTPVTGQFECSDEMVNKLYSNIVWTQRANFIDIPTDCPQRDERLGWTGDAQVYIRTACLNNDVHSFFTKWLTDLRDAQRKDGQFPMVAPLKVAGNDGGPAWADAGVICPWTIYEVYEDKKMLEENYEAMKKYISFCLQRCTDQLLPPKQFHCFGDWLNINENTPTDVIYMAYFGCSTKLVAKAASVLGKADDEKYYTELFEKIKESFNKAYVSEDGVIKGDSQTAYVIALRYGLLDGDTRQKASAKLIEKIKQKDWHLSTGFVGTKDLMLVLSEIGRSDVAYSLLFNDTFPSWGFTIKNGATSIWERWNGWTPDKGFADPGMNSFAHYSFGAVGQWMFENIGGIKSDGPAYKNIIIAPQVSDRLTYARTSYDSIRGLIESNWKKAGDKFTLDIKIPANSGAVVYLPAANSEQVKESGRPLKSAPGVRLIESSKGFVTIKIESGSYKFSSILP